MSSPASSATAVSVRQIELGFMFDHSLMSELSRNVVGALAGSHAVAELLAEKGIIDKEAFEARREAIRASVLEQLENSGLGLFVNDKHTDKYALSDLPVIDCAARVHLCRAACCTLRFPLSRQDVEEGIVRWDFGLPYTNLRSETGYCTHCTPGSHLCQIYDHRPGPCRVYDCRGDRRIWEDFDAMIVSAELRSAPPDPVLRETHAGTDGERAEIGRTKPDARRLLHTRTP